MLAAVVTVIRFRTPVRAVPHPRTPTADDEMLVDVLAAGLHPRVRSQADGSHYTSTDELPCVPGIDGVGRGPDGVLRYFILPDTTMGAMAEQTVIDTRRSIVLPESSDPVAVAAAMNPAMSSWVALRQRVPVPRPGRMCWCSGPPATPVRLAVQIAQAVRREQDHRRRPQRRTAGRAARLWRHRDRSARR